MAEAERKLANGMTRIDFTTEPSRYRHWRLAVDGNVATLVMDVDEKGGLFEGYDLKLHSYDLGVDIELADAFERIRFEHPQARVVLLRSGQPRVFCAGANIRMPAGRAVMPTRSISASSPTRRATPSRMPAPHPACAPSASSTARRPAAATSWRWRPITSSWWTTARPR